MREKSCKIQAQLKRLSNHLLTIILTVVLIFLTPLILLTVTVPFGTFRYLLHKSAKWLRPDLNKMVTLRGTVCVIDKMYTQPAANVVIGLILDGSLDLQLLKRNVTQNILKAKFLNGELKYPELTQYPTPWLGYYFWKEDKSFDLDRHVLLQGGSDSRFYTYEDVLSIYEALIQTPWTKGKPLWQITVVSNYYPPDGMKPQTVLFFGYHHSLSDGYSMLRLITEGLTEEKSMPLNAKPSYSARQCCTAALFWSTFPFVACYEFSQAVVGYIQKVPFKPIEKDQKGKFHVAITEKMSIQRIKEIKNHFNVSFSSVIYGVSSGALRDIMILKGIKVPAEVPCGTILPLPDHPEKLRNFMTVGLSKMFTGEPEPVKRLKLSSRDYDRLKRSVGPVLTGLLPIILGSTPAWGIRAGTRTSFTACGITNFPGGFQQFYIQGNRCVDVIGAGGIFPSSIGINFTSVSYMDGLRLAAVGDETVLTSEDVKEIARLLQRHVDILYDQVFKDV